MGKSSYLRQLFTLLLFGFCFALPSQILAQENADKWLNKMKNAIIEEGTNVEQITAEVEQTIMSPMGEVKISGTTTVNFETGDQRAKLQTPQGTVEVVIEDGKGVNKMGGQEIPLSDAQMAQIRTETQRNYLYIALNKDSLDAEYLGTETIDDAEHAKIKIGLTVPVTYYINTQSGLPAKITYAQFNQQTGQEIDVEVQYSDWQTVSGVTYAFKVDSYANGQKASTGITKELTVNE